MLTSNTVNRQLPTFQILPSQRLFQLHGQAADDTLTIKEQC